MENNINQQMLQRLDEAIQRLSDVSNEIKQILVVHETKLDTQDSLNEQMYDQIDKLHKRVGELRDEMVKKMESMEKWRWLVCGACIGIGALVGNSKIMALFGG